MAFPEWPHFHTWILQLEQEGLVTRTFRRLDPQRQKVVLDAILEEAFDKGPATLNIKEIARRAGVSIGSLYQYFVDRNRLLDFAVRLCVCYMVGMFEQYRPVLASMPLRQALHAYLSGGLEWGNTQVAIIRFFGRAAYQGDSMLKDSLVKPIADVLSQTTHEIISQAAARGEIRPDVDVDAAVRVINALVIAVGDSQLLPFLNLYFQVSDENLEFDRVLDALLDLIENGISPFKD